MSSTDTTKLGFEPFSETPLFQSIQDGVGAAIALWVCGVYCV